MQMELNKLPNEALDEKVAPSWWTDQSSEEAVDKLDGIRDTWIYL